MPFRRTLNLVVDLLMFGLLAFLAGSGFLMKWVLLPGREKILIYGSNVELSLFGLERHPWGLIHWFAGWAMLGLLFLHLILHWKLFVCAFKATLSRPFLRWVLGGAWVAALLLLLLFPFLFSPAEGPRSDHLNRRWKNANPHPSPQSPALSRVTAAPAQPAPAPAAPRHEAGEVHGRLRGQMSLAEAAQLFGKSPAQAKSLLGLPSHISDHEKMGRLRKSYGFTMHEAEEKLGRERP